MLAIVALSSFRMLQAIGHVLGHRHVRPQRVALEDHRHVAPFGRHGALRRRQDLVADRDFACRGSMKPAISRNVVVLPHPTDPAGRRAAHARSSATHSRPRRHRRSACRGPLVRLRPLILRLEGGKMRRFALCDNRLYRHRRHDISATRGQGPGPARVQLSCGDLVMTAVSPYRIASTRSPSDMSVARSDRGGLGRDFRPARPGERRLERDVTLNGGISWAG